MPLVVAELVLLVFGAHERAGRILAAPSTRHSSCNAGTGQLERAAVNAILELHVVRCGQLKHCYAVKPDKSLHVRSLGMAALCSSTTIGSAHVSEANGGRVMSVEFVKPT
jgi:hypothetical protein